MQRHGIATFVFQRSAHIKQCAGERLVLRTTQHGCNQPEIPFAIEVMNVGDASRVIST